MGEDVSGRRDLFALAVLHATELAQQLDGLPPTERERHITSYLADLRGELKAQKRNPGVTEEMRRIWAEALAEGGHSVRADLRLVK